MINNIKPSLLTTALYLSLALVPFGLQAETGHDHHDDDTHHHHGHHEGDHHDHHEHEAQDSHSPDSHSHGPHVHGISRMNLVLDQHELHIELSGPMANLVGFEHAPKDADQRMAIMQARKTLTNTGQLFTPSAEAHCTTEKTQVDSPLFAQAEHQAEEHKHHSDFTAEYVLHCDKPDELNELSTRLFELFPATQVLKVQFVHPRRQGAASLNHNQAVVTF